MKKAITVLTLLVSAMFCYSQESPNNKKLDISSGYFIGNDKVKKREFKQVLSTNEKAYSEFKRGNLIKGVGIGVAAVSAAYLGAGIGAESIESEGYIAGGLGIVGGMLAVIGGNSMVKKSIKTYNSSIEEVTFNLQTVPNGMGLVITF